MDNSKENPVRVLLVDDHRLVREGLAMLIETEPGFAVVAQAGDGLEALALVQLHQLDLAFIDLGLPGCDGITVTRQLKQLHPQIAVLVTTGSLGPSHVEAALACGAEGFVPKDADSAELLLALRSVANGGSYVSPALAPSATNPDELMLLSPREQQILTLIAAGQSNPDIAEQLHISLATVRKHRENLMRKLNLRNAAEITAFAIRHALIRLR